MKKLLLNNCNHIFFYLVQLQGRYINFKSASSVINRNCMSWFWYGVGSHDLILDHARGSWDYFVHLSKSKVPNNMSWLKVASKHGQLSEMFPECKESEGVTQNLNMITFCIICHGVVGTKSLVNLFHALTPTLQVQLWPVWSECREVVKTITPPFQKKRGEGG